MGAVVRVNRVVSPRRATGWPKVAVWNPEESPSSGNATDQDLLATALDANLGAGVLYQESDLAGVRQDRSPVGAGLRGNPKDEAEPAVPP